MLEVIGDSGERLHPAILDPDKKLGVIDEIIPEPAGGVAKDPKAAAKAVKKAILAALKELANTPAEDLPAARYEKFRAMGNFE